MTVVVGLRRHWRMLRVTAAALVVLGLLTGAVWVAAQEAGVGIRFRGLVGQISHTIVHQFVVEVSNLRTAEAYEISVSSDNAALGIDGCGTAAQTQAVTGVTSQDLTFIVYACAVGEATVTAEVRRAGASSPEASISQELEVEALPEIVIGPSGETIRTTAPGTAAARVAGAAVSPPGFVRGVSLSAPSPTSVKATWGDDTPNGGQPLTGFGLLFWRKGDPHPSYSNPLVKGPSARSHTYTGLQPNTTYLFRIHACNDDDSCGYWTNPPMEVRTPVGRPAKPHTISVDQKMETSARVNWRPHANTGGVSLTGFGIRWRVKNGSWPTHAQGVVDQNKRNHTMSPLVADTTYEVSLQSCNGPNRCSPWTAPLEFETPEGASEPVVTATVTATPTASSTGAPGEVTDLEVRAGNTRLTVRWNAPSTGGSPTRYEVEHREHGSTDPWTKKTVNAPSTTTTIGSLDNGTTYDVQVRACNTSGCGTEESAMGRPIEVTLSPLATPTGLDVMPMAQRRAKLTWTNVSNATDYTLEVQVVGETTSREPLCGGTATGNITAPSGTSSPSCEINLDEITAASPRLGLADHPAYRFRIRAIDSSEPRHESSAFAEVIIIDTPITSANGHSPGTSANSGRAAITWTSLATLHTHGLFSGGTYKLRYRRAEGSYSDWDPALFTSGTDPASRGVVTASSSTSHTLTSLTRYAIYAIQLLYEKDDHKVFSVRDSYVWSSEETFGLLDRSIATFPTYGYPLTTRAAGDRSMEFEYYICADTFPSANPEDNWIPFINHAMLQWQYATDELVTMKYKGDACADYNNLPFLNELVNEAREIVRTGEGLNLSAMEIQRLITDRGPTIIQRFRDMGVDGQKLTNALRVSDAEKSEITMIRDGDWADEAHVVFAFLTLGGDIGLGGCDRGCAKAAMTVVGSVTSTDIYLRESYHVTDGDGLLQAVIRPGAAKKIVFNTCPNFNNNYHRPYSSIVHEAGHALGLGHPDGDKVQAATMSYYIDLPQCAPHPLDVMAIYALYQSKVIR